MNRAQHINSSMQKRSLNISHYPSQEIPNECEQNVHNPASLISCNEMLPPCHKRTDTISHDEMEHQTRKRKRILASLKSRHRSQMQWDCSRRTNDLDEDSVNFPKCLFRRDTVLPPSLYCLYYCILLNILSVTSTSPRFTEIF